MTLKVRPRTAVHYILIYMMISWIDSYVYNQLFRSYVVPITGVLFLVFLLRRKYYDQKSLLLSGFLLCCITIVRIFSGGVGIRQWAIWVSCILIALVSVRYEEMYFLKRYVNVVVFLAAVSVVLYCMSIITPSLYDSLPLISYRSGFTYNIWTSGSEYTSYDYFTRGLFLFAKREGEGRNIGIFTEPGLYQMHLNMALFVLLFMPRAVEFSKQKLLVSVAILLVTLTTCGSATGFIGLAAILLTYIIKNREKSELKKGKILALILLFVACVGIEYFVHGEDSILYQYLIKKIFVNSMSVNAAAGTISTGAYRLETIIQATKIIMSHPFGVGYDQLSSMIDTSNTAGATVFFSMAGVGVLPILFIILYVLRPIVRSDFDISIKILLIILYFNTLLAQSSETYPIFLCIPALLRGNQYSMMWLYGEESDTYLFDINR